MAKKIPDRTKTGFSLQGWDLAHYKRAEGYTKAIGALYNSAIAEFARMATRINIDPDKPFSFDAYPATKAMAAKITQGLASKMKTVIQSGSEQEWLYANKKNDEFLKSILNTSKVPKEALAKYQDRNLDALKTFQARKVNGMDLSNRIWNQAEQFKKTMELGLDVGIGEGKSAQKLSKDLRQNLLDPDRLFRRVRDKNGALQLSKAAQAFHPGQGTYRSSYKNAMRLTRSEINMAYRSADNLRYKKLDFIVGFEVKLSNNHTLNGEPFTDICDELAGKYPKNFIFKGWHPQCRCFSVPILQDPEEFDTDELNELKAALNGTEYNKLVSKNTVTDLPDSFKNWMGKNQEKVDGYKSTPYFVKDNFKNGKIADGLTFDTTKAVKVAPIPQKAPVLPVKPVESPKPAVSSLPNELVRDSAYLKGTGIEFKQEFFNLADPNKAIGLRIDKKLKGSSYSPSTKTVNIADNSRSQGSKWHRESVVYHEYGHAIDWQRGLRTNGEATALMDKHRKILAKKEVRTITVRQYDYALGKYVNKKVTGQMSGYAYLDARINAISTKLWHLNQKTFEKFGVTRADVSEQIGSMKDTIMALNPNYGSGHTKSYFKSPGMKEAEFIAHCFENKFAGNSIFKKYMPDLYKDMIKYIDELK